MKDQILTNLHNPAQLERLYRADKSAFRQAFTALSPQINDDCLVSFWNARLNFVKEDISWGSRKDLVFITIAAILAGLISKLPAIFHLDEELFYSRNVGFIVFPVLAAYIGWRNKLSAGKVAFVVGAMLAELLFINFLPDLRNSDVVVLSNVHLLLFLWSVLGFVFVGEHGNNVEKRLGYLRYNGDLIVMTTLIVIAGVILSGMTIGLFSLIGFKIEKFYFNNVVVFCLPAAPIIGTYLIQANPELVGKISPVIARIFAPVVLVMLVVYLAAIVYSGKDPYNDREFLLMFNALLVGVLAIIFFSVAETSKEEKQMGVWVLFLLSVATVIVCGIALSAILFRISEWGITPNRAAVLGSNGLILVNLLFVTTQLLKVIMKKADITEVGKAIAFFLPVYSVWAVVVTFLFPLIFGVR